jgi:hypothetical protein
MHVRGIHSYFVAILLGVIRTEVAKIVKAYNDFLNGVKSQNLIQKSFIFESYF